MEMNEIKFNNVVPVNGYGPGFFRVGGVVYEGAILVLPDGVLKWGGYDDVETLSKIGSKLDVVFVGTGTDMAHLPAPFKAAMEEAGVGVEPMASPSACRTYNILISEGRRVALALLPV